MADGARQCRLVWQREEEVRVQSIMARSIRKAKAWRPEEATDAGDAGDAGE